MAHTFKFTVTAVMERIEGKFATRDEMQEHIFTALDGADPGSYYGDEGGQYEMIEWEVEESG